jgi:hypothetical protein
MGVYADIVREIMEVKKNFQELMFVHEGWSSNKEAHALTRSAIYDEPGCHVWLSGPHEGFCRNMLADCNEHMIVEQRVFNAFFSLPGHRRGWKFLMRRITCLIKCVYP